MAKFTNRYGAEVPLELVIDPDKGLGLPEGFGQLAEPPRPMALRDRLLLEIAGTAAVERCRSVALSEEMIERLEATGQSAVTPHIELCAQLQAASTRCLDRADFRLRVVTVSRAAGSMTGRFWLAPVPPHLRRVHQPAHGRARRRAGAVVLPRRPRPRRPAHPRPTSAAPAGQRRRVPAPRQERAGRVRSGCRSPRRPSLSGRGSHGEASGAARADRAQPRVEQLHAAPGQVPGRDQPRPHRPGDMVRLGRRLDPPVPSHADLPAVDPDHRTLDGPEPGSCPAAPPRWTSGPTGRTPG